MATAGNDVYSSAVIREKKRSSEVACIYLVFFGV